MGSKSSIRVLDMSRPDGELTPADSDRAVIIPMYDDARRACRIAAAFRTAGVLTLGMSPVQIADDVDCFDGIMYMNEEGCRMISREIIRQMELKGPVKIDAGDLPWLLRDNCRFTVTKYTVRRPEDRLRGILDFVADEFTCMEFSEGDRVAVIFTVNPHDDTVSVDSMQELGPSLHIVPEGVDLMWGIHFDNDLPAYTAGALAIIAGKKTIKIRDRFDEMLKEMALSHPEKHS